jgi:hypothetical protein
MERTNEWGMGNVDSEKSGEGVERRNGGNQTFEPRRVMRLRRPPTLAFRFWFESAALSGLREFRLRPAIEGPYEMAGIEREASLIEVGGEGGEVPPFRVGQKVEEDNSRARRGGDWVEGEEARGWTVEVTRGEVARDRRSYSGIGGECHGAIADRSMCE